MKKLSSIFLMLALSVATFAQSADFKQAVAKYKGAKTVTASAVKTKHVAAKAKDFVMSNGSFTIKAPNRVTISFDGGKDQLDMNGETFTMTVGGKAHTTSSKTNPQFATFHTVLTSIINGGSTDINKLPDVQVDKSGTNVIVTITPELNGKSAKRMMFSSFVITIDSKTSEIKSLKMNEKGTNYTNYEFSGYKF